MLLTAVPFSVVGATWRLPDTYHSAGSGQGTATRLQLGHPTAHSGLAHPGHLGRGPYPAVAEQPGLDSHRQTSLPLVQMRQQHPEPAAELRQDLRRDRHTTSTSTNIESNALI